jgi:hypothetical protein
MSSSNTSLRLAEWLVVFSVLLILIAFSLVAKIQAFRARIPLVHERAQVEVTILGHVSKPGCYAVEWGSSLSEVLVKANPKLYANVQELPCHEQMVKNCTYTVEKLEALTVFVEGACESAELRVLVGSRVCDLRGLIQFHPNADLSLFKKKRYLKNKEIIKISLKM